MVLLMLLLQIFGGAPIYKYYLANPKNFTGKRLL